MERKFGHFTRKEISQIPKTRLHKAIGTISFKELQDDGTFEGKLAVYNNEDLGGDIIEPGAFKKSIQERGDEVPLLYQHDADRPIGLLTVTDTAESLNVKGYIDKELPDGALAYRLIKSKIIKGLSIGFDTIKKEMDGGIRRLKEIRLWEGSIVTFPMNESAMITSVKARKEAKADFNTEYAERQLQEAGYMMWQALRDSLFSIPWSDMSKDEKLTAAQTSLEQFAGKWMEYLPTYIDWLAEEYDGAMYSGYYSGKGPDEKKEGRRISADSKAKISQARNHMKSADAVLSSLCDDDEAGDGDITFTEEEFAKTTSERKAGDNPPEPVEPDHSAAEKTLDEWIASLSRVA